jgi:pimeloyl-ACP methyl ester carboxylesterase
MKTLLIALTLTCAVSAQDAFRVQVTGKGQPIILIPGLSSSGETWDTTVAHYKDRFECHVLTVAGFVGVPRTAFSTPGPMLGKVRDQLADYIRAKKLEQPIIVGHSLGGFIAMDFAANYPDLAGKLVIVDMYPFTLGLSTGMTPEQAKTIAAQIRKSIAGMTPEAYEAYGKAGTATNNMAASAADKQRLIAWSVSSDRTAVADALYEMFSADLRDDLAKIAIPTLVLGTWRGNEEYGANHASVDANFHAQYAKLKGVEIHVSDNAHHFIMWDDPQWMFGYLDGFLGTK